MIFGHNREFYVIAASNLPGYDPYLTAGLSADFVEGERIFVYYPPEHSLSGTAYQFGVDGGNIPFVGTFRSEADRTSSNNENSALTLRGDFVLPYQSNLTIRMGDGIKSPLPLADDGTSGGSGFDSFFIKGSVFVGESSGARRYYSGPFKGYTKELECVCEGATAVNELDGSDCRGWLKGSIYEATYIPNYHDVFNYVGQPRLNVDHKNPFNDSFMTGNEFGLLDYSWSNIPYRRNRPIPYNALSDGKGNYAVLIGRRHAIVNANSDIDTDNLRFYSEQQGLTTATVASSVGTFEQLWNTMFNPIAQDEPGWDSYQGLSAHFSGVKILKFTNDLPEDILPISLYDPNGSDMVYYSLAFGQDGRGSVAVFCPPLTGNTTSGKARISFNENNRCGDFPFPLVIGGECCRTVGCGRTIRSLMLPGVSEDMSVGAMLTGDRGGTVITYYDDVPLFLGFINSIGYRSGAYADMVGVGIGSTKKYTFPWESEISPLDVLNLYMVTVGASPDITASSIKVELGISPEKYPFPLGFI